MPLFAFAWGVLAWASGAIVGVAVVVAALALRPRVVGFAARQAANAAAARDDASAAGWLRVALALGASDPILLLERAWHLARLGRRAAALAAYRRAGRKLPEDVGDAEVGAARVLMEMGELDAAEDMLARAIARDPSVRVDVERDEEFGTLLAGRPRFEKWRKG